MAQDHRLQQQRFELKYLIDEAVTSRMRDFLGSHLQLDDYCFGQSNSSYAVHTLYLDSDDLETVHASINGTKNRFKLRLRYYDDRPDTPVFFEVKRRVNNTILKQRCGVRREAVPALLAGHLPEWDQLLSRGPGIWYALQRFNLLQQQLNARPKAHNSYLREAWVSPNNNFIRVTFDRNIQIEPCFAARAVMEMQRPKQIFPGFVVLELKFTTRFPDWLQQLVRKFNLAQFSSAKYAEGVTLLGEGRFHDGEQTCDWQGRTPRAAHEFPASNVFSECL